MFENFGIIRFSYAADKQANKQTDSKIYPCRPTESVRNYFY